MAPAVVDDLVAGEGPARVGCAANPALRSDTCGWNKFLAGAWVPSGVLCYPPADAAARRGEPDRQVGSGSSRQVSRGASGVS